MKEATATRDVDHKLIDILDYLFHVGGSEVIDCKDEAEVVRFIRRVRHEVGSEHPIKIVQNKCSVHLILQ